MEENTNNQKEDNNTVISNNINENEVKINIQESNVEKQNINEKKLEKEEIKHNKVSNTEHTHKKEKDAEIDLGKMLSMQGVKDSFKKIKKSFSPKHKTKDKHNKDEGSISIIDFMIKHKTILLLLIPIILSIFLRIQPVYLPMADEWATNNVEGFYKNQVEQQIAQQYPNLPDTNRNLLIESEYNKFLNENKEMIKQQTKSSAEQIRSQFQDDSGQTYLLAIDPWFWYRMTDNYLEHGYELDVEIDGKYYNNHRLAPLLDDDIKTSGKTTKIENFQVLFQAIVYKVWNFFDSDVSLLKAAFFTPMIIATLSIIPLFFLVRKIAGDLGGLVAGILLAINPFGLTRTVAGFSDTDAFNFLFPVIIFGLLIWAIDSKKLSYKIILSSLAGLNIGLYSFSWGGWMFMTIFSLILLFSIICFKLLKMILTKKIKIKKFRDIIIILVSFLVSASISTAIAGWFYYFINIFEGVISFVKIKDVATDTIWPNVFTTVAELNPGNIGDIFSTMGGKLFLLLTLTGIILSFYVRKKMKGQDQILITGSFLWFSLIIYLRDNFSSITTFILCLGLPIILKFIFVIFKEIKTDNDNIENRFNIVYPLMFTIYLFGTLFSISRGIRFSLLLIPAYAMCFGTFAGIATRKLSELIKNTLNLNKTITYIILIIIIGIIVMQPIGAARNVVKGDVPSINDQWYETLIKIKEDSREDALINSWWDFGHWFKAIADRGVTLDGGGQDKPQAHWLGKLMLAKDEKETIGILKLLACGKNYPFNRLEEIMSNSLEAKLLLDRIIIVEKDEAEQILKNNNIAIEDIDYILERTHCDPPEDYFIASEDMVSKAGVWGHFGSWDFTKASMYNQVKGEDKDKGLGILTNEFNLDEETAKRYYTEIQTTDADLWISPWPGYVTNPMECKKTDIRGKIECPVPAQNQYITLEINLEKMSAVIPVSSNEKYYMEEVYVPTEDDFKVITINDKEKSIGLSATLIPTENGNYNIIVSHPLHAGSTFTKLFFAEGHGLKQFKKFHDVRDVTGARIIVWKVDWDNESPNKPFDSFFNGESEINLEI
jgi:dolichyl-phosphooligosaccharide-protein glycotransferase